LIYKSFIELIWPIKLLTAFYAYQSTFPFRAESF